MKRFIPTWRQVAYGLGGPLFAAVFQAEAIYEHHSSLTILSYCDMSVLMGACLVAIGMRSDFQHPSEYRRAEFLGLLMGTVSFFRKMALCLHSPAAYPMPASVYSAVAFALLIGLMWFGITLIPSLFMNTKASR